MEHVVFEGYAPHKVPVIVEVLTDNNNRTAPEMRVLFKKGGQLGAPGQQQVPLRPRRPRRGASSRRGRGHRSRRHRGRRAEVEPLTHEQNDDIPEGSAGRAFHHRARPTARRLAMAGAKRLDGGDQRARLRREKFPGAERRRTRRRSANSSSARRPRRRASRLGGDSLGNAMSDETSQAIFGDAVAASLEKPGRKRRGLFRLKKPVEEKPPFTHCEDCGADLHGRYCSSCGQVAVDYHRSFRHVVADVAESFLNWDSKFTKTLRVACDLSGLANEPIRGRASHALSPSAPALPARQHRLLFVHSSRSDSDQTGGRSGYDSEGPRRGGGGDEESGDPRPRARRGAEKRGRKDKDAGYEESWPELAGRRSIAVARAGWRGRFIAETTRRWILPELAKAQSEREDRSPRKQRCNFCSRRCATTSRR